LILAQVVVSPEVPGVAREIIEALRDGVIAMMRAFAAAVSTPYTDHLADAEALRRLDPYQTPDERAHLAAAVALARSVSTPR
jgi:hypothetical protein